jgi:Mg2+ and Co2+ transporter CorA
MAYDPESEVKHYAELLVGVVERHLTDDAVRRYTTQVKGPNDLTWEVTFTQVDAELLWERALPPEEQAGLALDKVGHLTDMVDRLTQLEHQTNQLLHAVANQVDERMRHIQVAVYQDFIHSHGVKLFNEVMDPRGTEPRG